MPKVKLSHKKINALKPESKTVNYYDTLESGLILRVTKTGYKSFSYMYRIYDKKRRYTIGKYPETSLADARKKVRLIKGQLAEGKDPQEQRDKRKNKDKPKTFADLAEEYKAKQLSELAESTRNGYLRHIEKELLPKLANKPINSITSKHVTDLLDDKAYTQGHKTTANRIRATLSAIFSFGIKRKLVDSNPVTDTPKYKESSRDRYYNETEIQKLSFFFNELQTVTSGVYKMLLFTGQRKSETLKMKWAYIADDVWTIPKELAKNKQAHQVPLSKPAKEILKDLKPITGESEWVFASPKDMSKPTVSLSRARQNIKKYSGVPDFRAHDLRRTFATYMAKLGIERTVLGKLLNHKGLSGDSQVTAIYDRHSYLDEKREAMEKYGDFIQNLL